jgi:hypothetical protein
MHSYQNLSRRSVLAGGCALALAGCNPPSSGTQSSDQILQTSDLPDILPSWADIPIYLKMATVAGSIGASVTGALGMPVLAATLETISIFAGRGLQVYNVIETINQIRANRFIFPDSNSDPKPFVVPKTNNINDFEFVPIFRSDVSLQFGIMNEAGGSFGENDIYTTIKRAEEPAPRTLNDVWGTGDLPHAIVSPAPDGSYDGVLPIGTLPPGAYISYSWTVPKRQQPSDEYIASNAFIGPSFISIRDEDYTVNLADAIEAGKNVEARFQLPNVT